MSVSSTQLKPLRYDFFGMTLLIVSILGCTSSQSSKLGNSRTTLTTQPIPASGGTAPKLVPTAGSPTRQGELPDVRSTAADRVVLAAASELILAKPADPIQTNVPNELSRKLVEENPIDEESQKQNNHDEPSEPIAEKSPTGVDALIQQAIATHPKIQAARSRVSAAQSRIPQARALPDPMAETLFWPIVDNAQQLASGRMTNQLSLSQIVPWPEKLRAQAAVAAREVGIAQAEMREIEREIAESVRLAYYEVWFSEQAYRIVTDNRKLAEEVVQLAQNRFRSGGSQQDVIRAELEVEKREQQLLELDQQREVAQADLATLVQQPTVFSIETAKELPLSDVPTQLDTLLATAEQFNPTLQSLAWQIQRDLQKQRLASSQKYPDLTYGVQYGMMSANKAISPVADGIDNISFSVGTTLPIWKQKIQAGICQSTSETNSSVQLHQSERNSVAGRLRRLFQQAHSLEKQRLLYIEKIIPRAEQAFELSQSEYTVGKISFLQLIDNFSEVLMFQVEVARIEATLAGVLAQIERTVGCEINTTSE